MEFLGLYHEPKMRSNYKKASPYLTAEDAKKEAVEKRLKNFKIVCKTF